MHQELTGDKTVVHDHICPAQRAQAGEGDQIGIARTGPTSVTRPLLIYSSLDLQEQLRPPRSSSNAPTSLPISTASASLPERCASMRRAPSRLSNRASTVTCPARVCASDAIRQAAADANRSEHRALGAHRDTRRAVVASLERGAGRRIVGAALQRDRSWPGAGSITSGGSSSLAASDRFSRIRPAAANSSASTSPSASLRSRVSTLPRISVGTSCGQRASSCAARPTTARAHGRARRQRGERSAVACRDRIAHVGAG